MGISPKPPVPGFRRKGRIAGPHSARRTGRLLPIPGQVVTLLCLKGRAIIGPTPTDQGPGRCAEAPQAAQTPSLGFPEIPLFSMPHGSLALVQRSARPIITFLIICLPAVQRAWPTIKSHHNAHWGTRRWRVPLSRRGTWRDSCPCLQTTSGPCRPSPPYPRWC